MKIDGEARQVCIRVKSAGGEDWGDSDTNEQAEIKDCDERA